MKIARNTVHSLRHDWLKLEDERGTIKISLLAHRNEIHLDVTIDGNTAFDYVTPRQLAEALLKLATNPHQP